MGLYAAGRHCTKYHAMLLTGMLSAAQPSAFLSVYDAAWEEQADYLHTYVYDEHSWRIYLVGSKYRTHDIVRRYVSDLTSALDVFLSSIDLLVVSDPN